MRNDNAELHRGPRATAFYNRTPWRALLVALCLVTLSSVSSLLAGQDFQAVTATATAQDSKTSPDGLWRFLEEQSIASEGLRQKGPRSYRTLRLNKAALARTLSRAPMEFTGRARRNKVVVSIPMPDGTFARFRVEESPIMEPALAARFPEIKTYQGQGIDEPTATLRLDQTPAGVHAMVLSDRGTVYVDPSAGGDESDYISYYKRDFRREGEPFHCLVDETSAAPTALAADGTARQVVTNGGTLHIYRLALAATGEYTDIFRRPGDTDAQAQARALTAMSITMNRVNGIFRREVSVTMVLVANETDLISTDAANDPYTDGDTIAMQDENQKHIDDVIGSANYDIGHVFAGALGGRGEIGGVCKADQKARGTTGRGVRVGDGFDVDFVAHEMGHQFNGRHTFNGTTSTCNGARTASAAYEPGSGSTIMAYAGVCGAEDLQSNSDDYFHVNSLEHIVTFVNTNGCDTEVANGNDAPVVIAGPNYTIPISTPFALTASGTDPNGDALTFCWEQYDLGTQSPPSTDDGSRPIFRSFLPTASPARTFPQLADVLNDTSTFGEALPTTNRTMDFQVTARDNRAFGGGVSSAVMRVNVTNSSGPFTVTQPSTGVVWTVGATQTVTWDVANTTAPPVSCADVRISLSVDGGQTFPHVLVGNTPNDGTATVTVPDLPSVKARIKVEAFGNIFFDISNADFIVNTPPVITCPANIVTPTDPAACTAIVNFTATATDTEPDPPRVNCSPAPGTAFPKGTTTVQCTATDSVGATDTCSFTVTVNDTENPVISCPANIIVGNDPGQCAALVNPGTATATDNCSVAAIGGMRSDGQPLNAPYPVGTTTILWKATDTSNNMASCTQSVTVNDVEPPVIDASVGNSCLWPPDHNLVNVGLRLAVADNCTAAAAIAVEVQATSDERPEIQTGGDGNFSPDAVITGTGVNRAVWLRRERMGGGDGRVYLIRITATDQYNNTALKVLRVDVPANQHPRTGPFSAPCAVDSRPVSGGAAPDGGFFAQSPPAIVIGPKRQRGSNEPTLIQTLLRLH